MAWVMWWPSEQNSTNVCWPLEMLGWVSFGGYVTAFCGEPTFEAGVGLNIATPFVNTMVWTKIFTQH